MELTDKINKANIKKEYLNQLIKTTSTDIEQTRQLIISNIDKHNEFMSFTKITNLYQCCGWDDISIEYKLIKKNITLEKKNIIKIRKIFSDIANYYNTDQLNKINQIIIELNELIDQNIFNCSDLKITHQHIKKKCTYLCNTHQVIKISDMADSVQVVRMNSLYHELKDAKIKLVELKTLKMKILLEMNNMQKQGVFQINNTC